MVAERRTPIIQFCLFAETASINDAAARSLSWSCQVPEWLAIPASMPSHELKFKARGIRL
jgi:hypothetical protein